MSIFVDRTTNDCQPLFVFGQPWICSLSTFVCFWSTVDLLIVNLWKYFLEQRQQLSRLCLASMWEEKVSDDGLMVIPKKGDRITLSYEDRDFEVIVIDSDGLDKGQLSVGFGFRMGEKYVGPAQSTLSDWVTEWTNKVYQDLFGMPAKEMKEVWKLMAGDKKVARNYIPEAIGLDAVRYCEDMVVRMFVDDLIEAHDLAISIFLKIKLYNRKQNNSVLMVIQGLQPLQW